MSADSQLDPRPQLSSSETQPPGVVGQLLQQGYSCRPGGRYSANLLTTTLNIDVLKIARGTLNTFEIQAVFQLYC